MGSTRTRALTGSSAIAPLSEWGITSMPTTSRSQRVDPVTSEVGRRRKTVVLVDDCELIREGLRRAFERTDDFEVLGEAANVADGIELVTACRPDVVIMDLKLPDGHGLDATQRIRADQPGI